MGARGGIGAIGLLVVSAPLAAQDPAVPARERPWNELATSWGSLQLHVTAMEDGALFSQNENSVSQVGALPNTQEFRVSRLELLGQLTAPFPWSFDVNANYNGLDQNDDESSWTIYDLNVSVPLGRAATVTVGEQEAGVGMERLSHGEDLSFMERSTMSEAFKKSHELGVRFTGTAAGERMTWSAGWFNNWLTDDLSFSESGNTYAGRLTGLAVDEEGGRRLLHLGASADYSQAQGGTVRARSRPEVHQAPDFVDTGTFSAAHTTGVDFELAAVEGPFTLTAEYSLADVSRSGAGNQRFAGWYTAASWVVTGEARSYDRTKGYFGRIVPDAPFSFSRGGAGAFEIAARYSWIDLSSQSIQGGKFDRWSGAVSWYPTRWGRFEFDYGYGRLQRSGTTGLTRFYQLRFQIEI